MDVARLKHLVAVVDTGSIRRAAELADCSSAAMSKSIKMLERETELQLIRPDGRGIRATEAGERLAARARRVLDEMQQLEAGVRLDSRDETVLRMASSEPFTTYFLGELAANEFAGQPITIIGTIPGQTEQAVVEGTADIGLTYAPVATIGIEHRLVGPVPMVVFVGRASGLERRSIRALPFVVPARMAVGATVRNRNADGWPDAQARTVAYEVNALESALELCRRGLGATYAPTFVARLHNEQVTERHQLVEHPLSHKLDLQPPKLYVVHRVNGENEAVVHKVITATLRILGG